MSEDRFVNGRLVLRQPETGYRAGADAMLLAAAVTVSGAAARSGGARLMEAGCGVGAALLATALRYPGARLIGFERDAAMAALARENVAANGLTDRVDIVEADVLRANAHASVTSGEMSEAGVSEAGVSEACVSETGASETDVSGSGAFDAVFCNPPFAEVGEGSPPHHARRHAHVTETSLDAWIAALCNRLCGGGRLTLIHRADKLGAILAALDGRLGGVTVLPIRPRATAPARRVLVRAQKGSRAPLVLLAGFDLHDDNGAKFTVQAEAIFRGDAAIDW